MSENEDKVPSEVADDVKEAIAEVRKALEGEDADAVKTAHDDLVARAQKIGEAIYKAEQESGPESGGDAPTGESGSEDDDVVDAEIVDDEDDTK